MDIIPFDKDYSKHKTVALLGGNTYKEGLAKKIQDYVEQGGRAFISHRHLNTTDRCDRPKVYAKTKEVTDLLGTFQEENAESADMICDNTNRCITQRLQPDGSRVVDVLHASANATEALPYMIHFRNGKIIKGMTEPCKIQRFHMGEND